MMGFNFKSLRDLDRTDGTVVLQQGMDFFFAIFVGLMAELIVRV
jgi:hypothetical protein